MKTSQFIIATFAALTSAAPLAAPLTIEARQYVGTTENEYTVGGCRDSKKH